MQRNVWENSSVVFHCVGKLRLNLPNKFYQRLTQRVRGLHILFDAKNLVCGLIKGVLFINVYYRQRMSRFRQIINRNVWFLGVAIKQTREFMLRGALTGVIRSATRPQLKVVASFLEPLKAFASLWN